MSRYEQNENRQNKTKKQMKRGNRGKCTTRSANKGALLPVRNCMGVCVSMNLRNFCPCS